MLSNDVTNNADEFGGQTIPEKIAEQFHGQDTVIVKLTPTSVAPERQRLNVYTTEVFQAILVRLPGRVYEAVMQDESRHQLIAVSFGRGAFFCQVKRSIATHLLGENVIADSHQGKGLPLTGSFETSLNREIFGAK